MERLKLMVGMGEELADEEESLLPQLDAGCNLSARQRAYGFAACLSLGLFCSFLSLLVLFRPLKFASTYTIGNLLSLGSTGFLVGPNRQLSMMFDPVRIVSTLVYLGSVILTLFCALHLHDKLLTLFSILVEASALIWYSLSYFPFAQSAAKKWFWSSFK